MADVFGALQGILGGLATPVRRLKDMGDGTWAEVVSATGRPSYPAGATALISASGNKANASAAATLTGLSTDTVYLSGFEVTGSGATAGLPVSVTVTGVLGGTLTYTYSFVAGVLVGNLPLVIDFDPPIPASAINTAIVVTCPASGSGGTNNTVVAHGYHL